MTAPLISCHATRSNASPAGGRRSGPERDQPGLHLFLRSLADTPRMAPDRLIIHRAAPLGRHHCRCLVGSRHRCGQANPILQLRRHLLMRPQSPLLTGGAAPLAAPPIPPVINDDADASDYRVEGQPAILPLAQGGKARPPLWPALAAVAPGAGASIPALRPILALPTL